MFRLRSCPRCKGDVSLDWDYYGWYEQCLQCGYIHDLVSIAELEERLTPEEREKVPLLCKHSKK